MRTTIGQIEARVALLEQPRKPISERANVVRNILGPNLQEREKLHKSIFDRSQDPLLKSLGRPPLGKVPAERQPIGKLALGLLITAFATPSNRSRIERAAATP